MQLQWTRKLKLLNCLPLPFKLLTELIFFNFEQSSSDSVPSQVLWSHNTNPFKLESWQHSGGSRLIQSPTAIITVEIGNCLNSYCVSNHYVHSMSCMYIVHTNMNIYMILTKIQNDFVPSDLSMLVYSFALAAGPKYGGMGKWCVCGAVLLAAPQYLDEPVTSQVE